jgi:hypothetical protein
MDRVKISQPQADFPEYMKKWLYNHSLSLVFLAAFCASLIGSSVVGVPSYNKTLNSHGRPSIGFSGYIRTGDFLDGALCNWQAAILQLTCLILGGKIFHQIGAPHSRKPEGDSAANAKKDSAGASWLYRNSLSIAFGIMFVVTMLGHIVFGTRAFNEANALIGQSPVSTGNYVLTANFWSKTLLTWQAEFGALVLYVILSVYLRQEGSPESKPVNSSNTETGEANK